MTRPNACIDMEKLGHSFATGQQTRNGTATPVSDKTKHSTPYDSAVALLNIYAQK